MSEETLLNASDEHSVRLQKLEEWQKLGVDPFTPRANTPRNKFSTELCEEFEQNPESEVTGTIAGRIMLKRDFGKAAFASLQDEEGNIQVYFKKDVLGDELYEQYKLLDLGDIISATGKMFFTKKGEATLELTSFQILTKALRPLPEKFHGLEDIETRYRKRYLDLITHREVKQNFVLRSRLTHMIRDILVKKGFLEVETPMMHTLAGGAAARPFITHHNALDMELYLRIAPELYLKRLVVGGMHKVFEINRNFRNEGIDTTHNPEFTMLELYEAYSDWRGMVDIFKIITATVSQELLGSTKISYQGVEADLGNWKEISYSDALREKGVDPDALSTRELALAKAKEHHLEISDDLGRWGILAELFEHLVEDHLVQPTIIFDYPAEISPLSKRKPENPELAERFEAFAFGMELCNGFSELNNPLTQRQVFEDQMKKKDGGDDEAMPYDEDFIEALEQGLPPTGGIGIGIDRLTMILIDTASIRDVILFPTMRNSK
ncbi:MAG: lysine--tRNA ligase [Brevinema sp.]